MALSRNNTALVALVALMVCSILSTAVAADSVSIQLQFDNRARQASGKAPKIAQAVADCICDVPPSQVRSLGLLGQGGILNAQSVATYECVGPSRSRVPLLQACRRAARESLLPFTSSAAHKCVKRYTDTWWPLDSIDVQKASCTPTGASAGGAAPSG